MRPLLLEIIVWELKWHETGKPCTIRGPGNKLKRVFYGKLTRTTTPKILSVSPLTTKDIHVQYTRTESDRLGYATVRLTGSPIARDLEKYTEVFTEGVKCWRIDSIGHGRTRPVSLCVGSTERKSDRERLRKIH